MLRLLSAYKIVLQVLPSARAPPALAALALESPRFAPRAGGDDLRKGRESWKRKGGSCFCKRKNAWHNTTRTHGTVSLRSQRFCVWVTGMCTTSSTICGTGTSTWANAHSCINVCFTKSCLRKKKNVQQSVQFWSFTSFSLQLKSEGLPRHKPATTACTPYSLLLICYTKVYYFILYSTFHCYVILSIFMRS